MARTKPRKKAITINLPPRIITLGTAYAEANERSLSALLEDLLRRHLESEGVPVGLPLDELIRTMAERYGITVVEKVEE